MDDLEGPTEIVIWRDFTDLLEEQNSGGKRRNKTKRRKYRVKRRKTKRNRKY